MTKVFVSHSTKDKKYVDVLVDFLNGIGVKKEYIFSSSLPGNDVKSQISTEIKKAISESYLDILFVSSHYYASAYCLNEEGIIWFKNKSIIVFGNENQTHDKMLGFINDDFKLRKLSLSDDLSYLADKCREILGVNPSSHVVNSQIQKLHSALKSQNNNAIEFTHRESVLSSFSTDDEKMLVLYIKNVKRRKFEKKDFTEWLNENEYIDCNVDNAIDLVLQGTKSAFENNIFECNLDFFRELCQIENNSWFEEISKKHKNDSINRFLLLWEQNKISDDIKVLLLYVIENKTEKLPDRWKAGAEITLLNEWLRTKNVIEVDSINYEDLVIFMNSNKFSYESEWTSYGNAREHTIYKSFFTYLLSNDFPFTQQLQINLKKYECPF